MNTADTVRGLVANAMRPEHELGAVRIVAEFYASPGRAVLEDGMNVILAELEQQIMSGALAPDQYQRAVGIRTGLLTAQGLLERLASDYEHVAQHRAA